MAALQSPTGWREVALRPGSQLLEDVSLLAIDYSLEEVVPLSEEVVSPARSSTPAPSGPAQPRPPWKSSNLGHRSSRN